MISSSLSSFLLGTMVLVIVSFFAYGSPDLLRGLTMRQQRARDRHSNCPSSTVITDPVIVSAASDRSRVAIGAISPA